MLWYNIVIIKLKYGGKMKAKLKNNLKIYSIAAGAFLGILGTFTAVPITGIVYNEKNYSTLSHYAESESFTKLKDQKINEIEEEYKNGDITYEESVNKTNYINSRKFVEEALRADSELGESFIKSNNTENILKKIALVEAIAVLGGGMLFACTVALVGIKRQVAELKEFKKLGEKNNKQKAANEDTISDKAENNDKEENNVENQ